MRGSIPRSFFTAGRIGAILVALGAGATARAVTIDVVRIANPGNANDPATGNLYGAVNYVYDIGKYEVTIQQYTDLLNAVTDTDTYSLYNTSMGSFQNSASGNTIGSGTNQANYYVGDWSVTQSASYSSGQNYLTNVGAFTNSASYYGTFDQNGNVFEWNDLTGTAGVNRGLLGGSFTNNAAELSSRFARSADSEGSSGNWGFRVAAVPEPATYAMALAGLACGGFSLWRRRTRA